MNKHQRPNSIASDILAEPAEAPVRHPCLNDLLADNLSHGDLVVINGLLHQFQHKEKEAGPHVFFDTDNRTSAYFYTDELLNLMNEGSYIRPGGSAISVEDINSLDEAGKQRLRQLFQSVRAKPRAKAQIKWIYVARFLNKISEARAQGDRFSKVIENAEIVTKEVDDMLVEANRAQPDPSKHLVRPKCVQPRTVLSWVQKEVEDSMAEMGMVHGHALKGRPKVLPQFVFDTIAEQFRALFKMSGKITPQQLFRTVRGVIREHNKIKGTSYPLPGKTLVWKEFKRFDPWYRLAKAKGRKAADLEYGAVGKLVRPSHILELAEMDGHKFDFHGVLGETSWGKALSKSGIDRCWVVLMLDVHSGYPRDPVRSRVLCADHRSLRMRMRTALVGNCSDR